MVRNARFWIAFALAMSLGLAPALPSSALPTLEEETVSPMREGPDMSLWDQLLSWLGFTEAAATEEPDPTTTTTDPDSGDPEPDGTTTTTSGSDGGEVGGTMDPGG